MAVSELAREGNERRSALGKVTLAIRGVIKFLTAVLVIIRAIKRRKKGYPSLNDLSRIVGAIQTAVSEVGKLTAIVSLLTNVFKF
jgi:hypothetical protein